MQMEPLVQGYVQYRKLAAQNPSVTMPDYPLPILPAFYQAVNQ